MPNQPALEHQWCIDERQYERHEARRGRRHAFEALEPRQTALIVVDMIPFFCEQNAYARGVVSNINTLAASLRGAGGTVVWVVPGTPRPSASQTEFFGPEVAERYRHSGGHGPLRSKLWPSLSVDAQDLVFDKTAPSAFFPGRCDAHHALGDRNVDTVLIVGTVANVCCESTARDASTLGYRTIMVADGNAAVSDADLNATLHTIYRSFGDVRSTAEVVTLIDGEEAEPRS